MKKLLLAALSAFVLLTACNVQKRQIRQLDGLVLQQPIEFARLSNLLNPCFSGKAKSDTITKTDTVAIAGSTTVNTVYVKGKGDTIIKTVTTTLPGKIVNRITTIHDTLADNRALAVVNNNYKVKSDSLIIAKTQLAQTHKAKNMWMWIAIGSILLILIYIVAKVIIFFYGGGWTNTIKKAI